MIINLKSEFTGLLIYMMFHVAGLLLHPAQGYAQDKASVSGTVLDEKGVPVIGATIAIKGLRGSGTSTDNEGRFTLPVVTLNSVLAISSIGYQSQEIQINGRRLLALTLVEDTKLLDDVVIIGYGTQRKGDVTSSVASLKSESFAQGAIKDVGQLIQGKVAGLAITNPSGDPTSTTQFRLRGTNTIGCRPSEYVEKVEATQFEPVTLY